jgi:serine/threonine protein kinase
VLDAGVNFEGYVVDGVLGRGGSATVYRAHGMADPRQQAALKVLADDHRGPAELARLEREFAFANRLNHPQVVSVFRRGDGWLTMELVDGGTVTTLGSLEDRLAALAQIADALDYVHRSGIVHCDVKPSNILVFQAFSHAGAVLIDFGVAHSLAEDVARHPQQVQASLPYVAPELLRGQSPSAATDEYALACSAVELITGSPPFVTDTAAALIDAQLNLPPPQRSDTLSWLPRAFDSIVGKAMAKTPELRYESCGQFVTQLTRTLGNRPAR